MIKLYLSSNKGDGASSLAMIFFALVIILILYLVSRRRKAENIKKGHFKNKLFSIYYSDEGFILIDHKKDHKKIIFQTITELNEYIEKSQLQE